MKKLPEGLLFPEEIYCVSQFQLFEIPWSIVKGHWAKLLKLTIEEKA